MPLQTPTKRATCGELDLQTGPQEDPVVEDARLGALIHGIGKAADTSLTSLMGEGLNEDALVEPLADAGADTPPAQPIGHTPVGKCIKKMVIEARNVGASDIHFEPYAKFYRVRLCTGGVPHEAAQRLITIRRKIASRIKVISRRDSSSKHGRQERRMKLALFTNLCIASRATTQAPLRGDNVVMHRIDLAQWCCRFRAHYPDPVRGKGHGVFRRRIEREPGHSRATGTQAVQVRAARGSVFEVLLRAAFRWEKPPGVAAYLSSREAPSCATIPTLDSR